MGRKLGEKDERLFCPHCDLPLQYLEIDTTTKTAPIEPSGVIRLDLLRNRNDSPTLTTYLHCQRLVDGKGCERRYPCTLTQDGSRTVINTVDFGDIEGVIHDIKPE